MPKGVPNGTRKAVVTIAETMKAFSDFKMALKSVGIDTGNWELVNTVGAGYAIYGCKDSRIPSRFSTRPEAVETMNTWVSIINVLKGSFTVEAVDQLRLPSEIVDQPEKAIAKVTGKKVA